MIRIRRAEDRGRTRLDWLDSRHTFSFGDYRDPAYPGFRALRVLNEDHVAPASGFGTHPHRDMEILTWVLGGTVEHRDSEGHRARLEAGDVQRMTAGTGVLHSEWNPSADEPLRFLQIWIEPERKGLAPGYEQRRLLAPGGDGGLRLIASPDGRDGSLRIHQDATLWAGRIASGDTAALPLDEGRHGWVQVVRGRVAIGDGVLEAGDGAALEPAGPLVLTALGDAELLAFDLA